jgi:hypothetical protein
MSKEAMKEARSVIGTINTGKLHTLTIGDETVYWQREEWVRWALDEVLPQLDKAIANAEKQEQGEPVAVRQSNGEIYVLGSALVPIGAYLYTTPQQRKPLTRAEIINAVAVAFNFNSRDYDEIIEPVARAIEAAHGIRPSDFKE